MDMVSFKMIPRHEKLGTILVCNGSRAKCLFPFWVLTQEAKILGPFYGYEDFEGDMIHLKSISKTPVKGEFLQNIHGVLYHTYKYFII